MHRSIQLKIATQTDFYRGRDCRASAANAWLDLLDSYPESYGLRDGTLEYRDPLYDLVVPHIREINRIAAMELEAMHVRLATLAENSNLLALALPKSSKSPDTADMYAICSIDRLFRL